MHKIVTISREFGSGGRELGKRLAEELGIPCYDHQIIEMIAKENGFDERYVANVGEKSIEAAYPMTIGHSFAMPPIQLMDQPIRVAAAQRQIIENFAKQGDCVIVGRCADYILREKKNLLTVFLHAPMEYRVKRVMTDQSITNPTLAEKTIKKQDKARADYYNFFTHKKWGDAGSAMLSVDTSMLDTDGIAALIADAVTMVERNK